jgi:endonuclease/exonuclease/phosphatase (EEP) superfamily protein YafD
MRELAGRGLRVVVGLFVAAVIAAIAALTALQRLDGETWWWVELSRYLPYYWLVLLCVVSLGASMWLGRMWVAASLAALALLAGVTMQPEWGEGSTGGEHVRVMTFNIKAGRAVEVRDGVLALGVEVARHDPDILVMQDANGLLIDRGAQALAGVQVFGLPHVYALGQYVVASRWPLLGCNPGQIGFREESHRYLRCTVDVGGTALTLVTAHFLSPRNGLAATRFEGLDGAQAWQQNYRDRLAQSQALARDIATMPRPLVVAGDLNAPESSEVVQTLLRTGVRDAFSAAGRGYGYTYGQAMRGMAFLRIDHILTSSDIAIADSFVGRGEASEHRPVIADLLLRPRRETSP